MAPKNYSVKSLTKEDEAEVQAVLKANPNWKLKHARERVAQRKFLRQIAAAAHVHEVRDMIRKGFPSIADEVLPECDHQYAESVIAPLGVRCLKCGHFVGAWE